MSQPTAADWFDQGVAASNDGRQREAEAAFRAALAMSVPIPRQRAESELREAYAMRDDTVATVENRRALTGFFWWTAWAATTERPGAAGETLAPDQAGVVSKKVTYTNNWPSEPLVGNIPPPALWVWSASASSG